MCGIWGYISFNPKYSQQEYLNSFLKIKSRGPDNYIFHHLLENIQIGFHRLAIHCLSPIGNQPFITFVSDTTTLFSICNGEIYNYDLIRQNEKFDLKSSSDCEVIPHLYLKYGDEMIRYLDGEYAFIIFEINHSTKEWRILSGRDPFGVRPLFYGLDKDGFAIGSEMKSIFSLSEKISVFPPGCLMKMNSVDKSTKTIRYYKSLKLISEHFYDSCTVKDLIRSVFIKSVMKRLSSERPIGCLLSGGLDSSIVSAVTAHLKSNDKIHTFTIGLEGATDIKYAEMVANHIGSIHQTFIVTVDEALSSLEDVIYITESYDCTTVRASVWQYLLGKKIKQNTNIKVLLTGEGSDELMGGYLYFHKAPSEQDAHLECIRLLEDIHRFDGLRVDRAMSCHGLEVRIPFLDPEFVELFLSLSKELRVIKNGKMEKQLFRDSFQDLNLLPEQVLYRKKEAFSDGTSCNEKSWFVILQEHIEGLVSDEEFEKHQYGGQIDTKEKYYYRKVFEEKFGNQNSDVIPYYWLPKWCGNVSNPSARVLDVYFNENL